MSHRNQQSQFGSHLRNFRCQLSRPGTRCACGHAGRGGTQTVFGTRFHTRGSVTTAFFSLSHVHMHSLTRSFAHHSFHLLCLSVSSVGFSFCLSVFFFFCLSPCRCCRMILLPLSLYRKPYMVCSCSTLIVCKCSVVMKAISNCGPCADRWLLCL
jgi:hypothetical protein